MTKEKIKNLRIMQRLSREQFGETLGVSQYAVKQWELGNRKPSQSVLMLIKKIYKINLEEF